MILTVKATNIERTSRILDKIDAMCAKLEKFAPPADPDGLIVKVEVGRISKHHRKGTVYRAEVNVTLGGTYLRAKAAGGDALTALGEAQDEMERRLLKAKKKAVSVKHREGVAMKRVQRV